MNIRTQPQISKKDMNELADSIELYLDELEEVMIIPDAIKEDHGDKIKVAIHEARKLIKKLRKGDKSVFVDEDEWSNFD